MNLFFFRMFFLSPEIGCFFENRQQSNERAGQKQYMFFSGNDLNREKKHSGLKGRMVYTQIFLAL